MTSDTTQSMNRVKTHSSRLLPFAALIALGTGMEALQNETTVLLLLAVVTAVVATALLVASASLSRTAVVSSRLGYVGSSGTALMGTSVLLYTIDAWGGTLTTDDLSLTAVSLLLVGVSIIAYSSVVFSRTVRA